VVLLERLEKRPRATLAAFPPLIFAGIVSISIFHVSPLPPRGNALGGLYIAILGHAEDPRTKMNGIAGLRTKRAGVAWSG
jgi:hypothetical protein